MKILHHGAVNGVTGSCHELQAMTILLFLLIAVFLNFVKRMRIKPTEIRIIHGDKEAKAALKQAYDALFERTDVIIPHG